MAVIRVPADYRTIQEAVNAARPGDTVRVAGGVYAEAVTIREGRDRLAIIGSGPDNVILQGEGEEAGFAITGSARVTLAGFTVIGFLNGIQVATSDNVIRDMVAADCIDEGFDVLPDASRNLFIRVLSRNNGGEGIEINGAANWVIGSEFESNGDDGIDINGEGNLASENRASGHFRGENPAGITMEGNRNLAVNNCLVGNRWGLSTDAAGLLVFGNVMSRNSELGALFQDAADSLVLANEFSCHGEEGIHFNGATRIRVILNKAEENGTEGFELSNNTTALVVDDNEVKGNGLGGIRLTLTARDDVVRRNELEESNPDLLNEAPADAGNVLDENDCETSQPPGFCC